MDSVINSPACNSRMGEDPAMAIFDDMDINGDGVISREEFRIAIEKMRHLDLQRMKRSLAANDIAFNFKGAALGRQVIVTEDEFNAWHFIKCLPPYDQVQHFSPPVALPPKESRMPDYTLVLDMDETLLHCSPDIDPGMNDPDHTFQVSYQGSRFPVHAWLRPKLHDFLERVHGNFEVVVFTASKPEYANKILDIVDPHGKYFHHRLFRDSCMPVEGSYVKDLNVLGRDVSKCILVDNSPHVFGYNLDNGIPISSWYQDRACNELEKLEWFLRQVEGDVRQLIRQKFQCYKLVEEACLARFGELEPHPEDTNNNKRAPGTSTDGPIASASRIAA